MSEKQNQPVAIKAKLKPNACYLTSFQPTFLDLKTFSPTIDWNAPSLAGKVLANSRNKISLYSTPAHTLKQMGRETKKGSGMYHAAKKAFEAPEAELP